MHGTLSARCVSFASRGLRDAVCAPLTTKLLLPIISDDSSSNCARKSIASAPACDANGADPPCFSSTALMCVRLPRRLSRLCRRARLSLTHNVMIERRVLDEHLRRPLRSHLRHHQLPVEFRLPRGSQRLPHIQIDQISIRRRPRPRRVTQQRKFNRQPPALLHDKLIYAARVRFQQPANFRARLLRRALRRLPHPEDPILLVDFQRQKGPQSPTNRPLPPAEANPFAKDDPAPSRIPAPSPGLPSISRESTAAPTGRDRQSLPPSIPPS